MSKTACGCLEIKPSIEFSAKTSIYAKQGVFVVSSSMFLGPVYDYQDKEYKLKFRGFDSFSSELFENFDSDIVIVVTLSQVNYLNSFVCV